MQLSIITINLNNEQGLLRTMQSVAAQTYHDFEYIVVDGASTDGSVAVIKHFADLMPTLQWLSEPDKGIYNAMNKGVRLAKGDYLLFLNSGDCFVDKNVLQSAVSAGLDADLVYGQQLMFQDSKQVKMNFYLPEDISFFSFYGSTLPHQCTFIRRQLFSVVGLYNEENRIVSDWEWNMLALFKHNVSLKYINVPISIYDTTGISSDISMADIRECEKRRAAERHFPRIMLDYDNYERHRQSRGYRFLNILRRWKQMF